MIHALPYCAAAFVFGYLCGSIPFGILLTRLAGGPDLRSVGSGNIGATNVLRTGREVWRRRRCRRHAQGHGRRPCTRYVLGHDFAMVAAVGAFLGHLFPVWLRFRGGKGVATYIGVLLGIAWPAAIVFCAVWLAIAAVSRYSSLAALDRQRRDAGFPVVARRRCRGGGILIAVGGAVDHAPRQYRPAAERHRRQNRRAVPERQRLISLSLRSATSSRCRQRRGNTGQRGKSANGANWSRGTRRSWR